MRQAICVTTLISPYLVLFAGVLEGNEVELLAIGRVWPKHFARSVEMKRIGGVNPDPHRAAFACWMAEYE